MKGKTMLLRKLHLCFLSAALATTSLASGCRDHHDHDRGRDQAQPAQTETQPAQSEPEYYNRWESETHREHRDLNQRTTDEQKQYRDWRQQHPNTR
jgi:hypothetical protein